MIWSGFLIYWANDVYRIGWGNTTILKFFPKSFYEALHMKYRLAEGMAFHFAFMWLFALNGLAYVLYTAISGQWRLLVPRRRDWRDAWLVVLHDLHIRKSAPPVDGKYNPAQRIAYTAIIIMGVGSVLSGIAIYKPVQAGWLCTLFGGYAGARVVHFALTIGYCLFFVIHIIQVIVAGWNNFRSMIAGFEVEKLPDAPEQVLEAAPAETILPPMAPEADTTK